MTIRLDPDEMPSWLAGLWPPSAFQPLILAGINDDDCAVLRWGDRLLVITIDYLNSSPIGSQLGIATPEDLGRLIVAASISDLCGSGAKPEAMLTAITMPRGTAEDDFRRLMIGVHEETKKWNIPVVGGDTKLGDALALLSVAIGSADSKEHIFLKNAAQAGELLWCSGPLGSCNAAAVGFKRSDVSDDWKKWARSAILQPALPVEKSQALSKLRIGRGGIDISDGLGADLQRMCAASSVGATLYTDNIPLDPHVEQLAFKLQVQPWSFAFGGGGDFQFLVTTPRSEAVRVSSLGFHNIGEVTAEKTLNMRVGNHTFAMPTGGHRDARGTTFTEEILTLMNEVKKAKELQ